jgi:hypothetical protein
MDLAAGVNLLFNITLGSSKWCVMRVEAVGFMQALAVYLEEPLRLVVTDNEIDEG